MRISTLDAVSDAVARHVAVRGDQGWRQNGGGPRVVASGNFATPFELLGAVDAGLGAYRLNLLNAQPGIPARDGVTHETSFVGPAMRHSPSLRYLPTRLSLLPSLLTSVLIPDIVVLHCSTPRDGKVSMGVEVNVLPAAVDAARAAGGLVFAQINPRMPYVYGDGELPTDLVDLGVEVDVPLSSPLPMTPDATCRTIGDSVAAMVPNGATVQMGIGAIPDAALAGLAARRGLRIWSEMFSDGVLLLDAAGALDRDAPIVASFVFGSAELYSWVDRNPRVRLNRTETVNNPGFIAQQPAMTSINSALQVDLFGQANASRLRGRIHSGFGGATDFLVGALHAPGGQAMVALRSWHPKAQVSSIVPLLAEPATSFQPSAVITEQGTARLRGHSEREQAAAIIADAAHPDVRADLTGHAARLGLA